jgi:parallel beta-helix repeat protein
MSNDGSADAPWSTLSAVITAGLFANGTIKAGDTVHLRSGNHGSVILNGDNADFITIAADAGSTPVVSSVNITGSRWIINGLTIQSRGWTLVNIRIGASNNIVVGNHILSQPDVASWNQADWQRNSSTAVSLSGQCATILNNNIENVRWGVLANADHELIQGNIIDNIGDDGIQVRASDVTIRGNRLTNFHDIGDGNHADMIQAVNRSNGVYRDITIDSNFGINQTDPNLPFPNAATQGITEFDGQWDNYNVINNVVVTNHWHGIAIYGATNANLLNNTVLGNNPSRVPWIGVFDSKTGAPPVNNIVRNNLAGAYNYPKSGYIQDHNVTVSKPAAAVFKFDTTNYAFDLHLKAGSPANGAGTTAGAPNTDIAGAIRVPPIDAGAYAFTTGGGGGEGGAISPSGPTNPIATAGNDRTQSTSAAAATQAASNEGSCIPLNYSKCGFPDATNTGVPAGIVLTSKTTNNSCLKISEDNTVIDAMHVTGCIDVEANNVTIQNSRITGTTWWAIKYGNINPNATGLKILHVKIDSIPGQGPAAQGGYNYGISTQGAGSLEVGYSDISGFKDGIDVAHGHIHDNWIHDMSKYTDAHTQGIYVWRAPAGTSLLIKHNTITDIIQYSTAAIFMILGIHDVTVEDNWLAGGSYTLYGGGRDARNIQALNNKFSTEIAPNGGHFGPISYWSIKNTGNTWSGNVWVNGPRAGRSIAPAY